MSMRRTLSALCPTPPSRSSRFLAVVATAALSFGLTACDESQASYSGDQQGNKTTNNNSNVSNTSQGTGGFGRSNAFEGPLFVDPSDAPDPTGQGEDNKESFAKPGAFHGSWRVSTDDSKSEMVLRLSMTQEQASQALDGSYIMGGAMGAGFAQNVGKTSGTSSEDGFSVTFNPTNDKSDKWTLTALEKVDADTFRGKVENIDKSLTKGVVIARENPEENSGIRNTNGL